MSQRASATPLGCSGTSSLPEQNSGVPQENKCREGFPGSFFNSKPFPEGEETPPLAIAVSDDRLYEVEGFLSHLLGIHVGEFSFYSHWAGSAL